MWQAEAAHLRCPGRREGCRDVEVEEGVTGKEKGEGSRGEVIEEKRNRGRWRKGEKLEGAE